MLRELFKLLPDALIVVDEGGRVVRANGPAERLFGYPPQGLDGIQIEALMPEGTRARHAQHRVEYMSAPRVRPMGTTGLSLTGQRLDGGQFPVEISLGPLESQGRTLYLAVIRDVSESQRVRQALVRGRYDALVARVGQLALASSDETVIEGLPEQLKEALQAEAVMVVMLAPDGQSIRVAGAHGIAPERMERFVRRPHAETGLWRALVNGQPLVAEMLADGSQDDWPQPDDGRFRRGAVMPIGDREHPIGALIVLAPEVQRFDHDAMHLLQLVANLLAAMIQRRRTEEQLAHAQRLEAIGQLTGGVAHDFNNLLTVMSGNLQLLEEQTDLPPQSSELIESALRAVSRGAELTAKLLAFARRQRLLPRAVDPEALLREIAGMLQRALGESIRVRIENQGPVAPAYVDAAQLDTALLNLALNARDAMPQGGEITFSARDCRITPGERHSEVEPGHYVVFTVGDTGSGMTPETLAHAVEPFFTTREMGNGLGLSMVYGFVKQSNGFLRIDSRLGYGTQVELFLPTAPPLAVVASAPLPVLAPGSGETILVVEDEDEVRKIAEAFLGSIGYRVRGVGSAMEALHQLQEDPTISLLFSDVRLGSGMDGHELALAARALRPALPVLLTSGYADENVVPVARDPSDGFELLRKPYRHEELAMALRRSLGRPT
ncbi:PAS domain S-box protein [Lysobacter niastensis]|uniref:histidine kinase n=1 Tax=Lysobacter niastensis TaxID=380629 RepID=A0ABS0B7P1_9GAMM|nr:PAS domain S-box protein [Lysobacter niastensis]MBF6024842.1 PAS domain S-box protein [Lysobacter niastensis]